RVSLAGDIRAGIVDQDFAVVDDRLGQGHEFVIPAVPEPRLRECHVRRDPVPVDSIAADDELGQVFDMFRREHPAPPIVRQWPGPGRKGGEFLRRMRDAGSEKTYVEILRVERSRKHPQMAGLPARGIDSRITFERLLYIAPDFKI